MGTRANNDVTAGARKIMDYCKKLQVESGLTATEFAAECGFSRNYWFVRARYDAPLTVSDCSRIAQTCGMTLMELMTNALAPEGHTSHSHSGGEIDEVVSKLALAANIDKNKELEANTPRD